MNPYQIISLLSLLVVSIATLVIQIVSPPLWQELEKRFPWLRKPAVLLTVFVVALALTFAPSCLPRPTEPSPPKVVSDKETLKLGEQIALTVKCDPSLKASKYKWNAEFGTVPVDWVSAPSVTYTAPNPTDIGDRLLGWNRISVIVRDSNDNEVAQAETKVRVVVNINEADLQQLDLLDGIGPVLAQRIIDYRTKNGPFKTIEEIEKVNGIGEKIFNANKDMMTVH